MDLASTPHTTALVYSPEMTKHQSEDDPNHVENPERIKLTTASDKEIGLVHTEDYIRKVKEYRSSTPLESDIPETYPTYTCDGTYDSAAMAVGACLCLADAVLSDRVRNGIALVRPPGHHAERQKSEGFCFFNNIAVVARYIQTHFPDKAKKILILDWDVHHGNGTQREFYEDCSVLYISLHRYDGGQYYPHSPDARQDATGKGEGEGFNVNIPWSGAKMGNAEYLRALNTIILPIAKTFQPNILLVSAGFDAAEGDPLGQYHVTAEMYGHMLRQLIKVTNRKALVILEGGYNLEALANCVSVCVKTLLADSDEDNIRFTETNQAVNEDAKIILNEVLAIQGRYWPAIL